MPDTTAVAPPSRARIVARAWAVVFGAVGVAVALAPDRVAGLVEALAAPLGLRGPLAGDDLVHALAISLMASITAAAWHGDAARALLVAKWTSTAAFLALAALRAPAWLLAAGGDAFVALTLIWSRRPVPPPPLVDRLLRSLGGAPDSAAAWARAMRLPAPLDAVYADTVNLVEWLGPALLLGRPARASRLPDAELDALQERLLHSRVLAVRGAYALLRAPLGDAAWPAAPHPAPAPHPLERRPQGRGERFDVVVIGSGAGGAPLAARLAEAGRAVAVLEAGDVVRPAPSGETVERHYVEQGTFVTLEGAPILAGRAVGGTTPINSGTCLRPLPERLAEWDAALGTRFAEGLLDPWLEDAEDALGVCTPPPELLSEGSLRFDAGLRLLGREGASPLPRNAPGCEGSGLCCFGCPTGAKRSVDRGFLPQALDAGAQLFRNTRALRVREEADGVLVDVDGPEGPRTLRAGRVVIAGGALGTPALLRRSRLGTNWREAGRHLRLHPATKVLARFPGALRQHPGVPQDLGWRAPELPRATFEGIHVPAATLVPVLAAAGARQRAWMGAFHRHASFGLMVHDRGTGHLSWVGDRCVPRYRLHPEDAADLLAGARIIARAFLAAGAERVLLPLLGTANEAASVDELDALPAEGRHVQFASFHPQGTAGLGRLVDPDLGLLGASRVDVCDASVLPSSPGANPQLTLVALSLRLAARRIAG